MEKIRFKPDSYVEHEGRQILEYVCKATREDISKSYERNHTKTGHIPVYQRDEGHDIVGYYKSISEAARDTGINQSNISRVLDSELTAGGFTWTKE